MPVQSCRFLLFLIFLLSTFGACATAWQPSRKNNIDCRKVPSLADITIDEVAALFESCGLTCEELVEVSLARIAEVNDKLHAVIEINPDARRLAREIDVERSVRKTRTPLQCIPIVVKDNIATRDLMNNTAGSVCMKGIWPIEEATAVAKLRNSGAIILGKANLGEWALARSTGNTTTFGWSGAGGQTYGAYYELQDPGGSSSGSAVATSIGLSIASLGTETRGSITVPADWNNLVGVKTTLGLVSRHMLIPVIAQQDVIGPIARTVRDAAYLLSAIAGKDPKDNYTLAQPFDKPPDYAALLSKASLEGSRIGVPWNAMREEFFLLESEHEEVILEAFNASLVVLESLGASIIHTGLPSFEHPEGLMLWNRSFGAVFAQAGMLPLMNKYLNLTEGDLGLTFDAIINCTLNIPAEQYPRRDIAVWDASKNSTFAPGSLEAWSDYQHAYRQCGTNGIFRAMEESDLDALILPPGFAYHMTAYAGSPVVTVPMGAFGPQTKVMWRKKDDPEMRTVLAGPGTPYGLSFLGKKWGEEQLLGFAYAYEQSTMARSKTKPVIQPRTELNLGRSQFMIQQKNL